MQVHWKVKAWIDLYSILGGFCVVVFIPNYIALNTGQEKTYNEKETVFVSASVNSPGEYIQRFYNDALEQEWKHGIPVSVTMAQALLESGSGTSYLAKNANNHFGIKCKGKKCRKGHCLNWHDDHPNDRFRIYKTAYDSYEDHSNVLRSERMKARYAWMFPLELDKAYRLKLKIWGGKTVYWRGKRLTNGKQYTMTGLEWWCVGLSAAVYATDPHYADKLWKIIVSYDLY